MELWELALLTVAGFAAGWINVLACHQFVSGHK